MNEKSKKRKFVISNSFTVEQIEVLGFIADTLLRGGDPRAVAGHKAFAGLAGKIYRMRDKARKAKASQP